MSHLRSCSTTAASFARIAWSGRFRRALVVMLLGVLCLTGSAVAQGSDYGRAVQLYNGKKFAEALAIFEGSGVDAAQSANAGYYRGLCYIQLGKTKEGVAVFRQVATKYAGTAAATSSMRALASMEGVRSGGNAQVRADAPPATGPIDWDMLPDHVVVPFRKSYDGHMYVTAEMNGVPVPMIFDTGAAATTCAESLLSESNIRINRSRFHGRALGVGGEVSTNLALVSLRLGAIERNIPLWIVDDRAIPDRSSKVGRSLLGQSFFSDIPYMIDDSKSVIIFSRPSAALNGGSGSSSAVRLKDNEVPFRKVGGNILVTVKINGRECDMFLDTGAATVAFADRHLALCGLNRPTDAFAGHGGGVGGQRDAFAFEIDSVRLGPVERKNVRAQVLINANFDKPLLGQSFLSGLRYTIDPTRNSIRFE